jgi:anti-sigma regulatory factor (Ser/Thr protein kinase)
MTTAAGILSALSGYPYGMFVSTTLPPDLSAPSHARAQIRQTLQQWELTGLLDDAELVASELVANAVRHAASPVVLTLERRDGCLMIAVQDAAPDLLPRPRAAGAEETGGRGMLLVDRLAQRWGCSPSEASKVVWAELAIAPQNGG